MLRTELLGFKANDLERRALELMQRYEGRNKSEMMRECLREAALRRGLWPTVEQPELAKAKEP